MSGVMGDHHHGPAAGNGTFDKGIDEVTGTRVETREGLIEKEQARLGQ
jgi:hypothetical protein